MIKEDNQENGISIDAINFDGMDTSSADSEVAKPIADDSAIDNYLNIEKREKTTKYTVCKKVTSYSTSLWNFISCGHLTTPSPTCS